VETIPGTWGGIAHAYRASPKFEGLAPRTQAEYQRVFNHLAPFNGVPFDEFDAAEIARMMDEVATRDYRFARAIRQIISLVSNWAISRGIAKHNPAERADMPSRPENKPHQNRPWTSHELAVVLSRAPAGLKAGIALGA